MSWPVRYFKAEPGFQGRSGCLKVYMLHLVLTLRTCAPKCGGFWLPSDCKEAFGGREGSLWSLV